MDGMLLHVGTFSAVRNWQSARAWMKTAAALWRTLATRNAPVALQRAPPLRRVSGPVGIGRGSAVVHDAVAFP